MEPPDQNFSVLRGATLSKKEREELYFKACKLIQSVGKDFIVDENLFDLHLKTHQGLLFFGYVHIYFTYCRMIIDRFSCDDSDITDVKTYKQLLEIDAKLGTTQTEQLFLCVLYATGFTQGMDFIKV